MRTEFITVLGEPVGKGRPRFAMSTGHAYTPQKTANYENLIQMEYEAQSGYRFPDDVPLELTLDIYCGIPKSASKKKRAMMEEGSIRPTKKPDADNVVKIVGDALNNVAYKDDTQIVDVILHKWFSDKPRLEIWLKEALPDKEQ